MDQRAVSLFESSHSRTPGLWFGLYMYKRLVRSIAYIPLHDIHALMSEIHAVGLRCFVLYFTELEFKSLRSNYMCVIDFIFRSQISTTCTLTWMASFTSVRTQMTMTRTFESPRNRSLLIYSITLRYWDSVLWYVPRQILYLWNH